jgi:hypothetical protein
MILPYLNLATNPLPRRAQVKTKQGSEKPQVFRKNLAGRFLLFYGRFNRFFQVLQVFPKFVDFLLFSVFKIGFDCILNYSVLLLQRYFP